MREKGLRVRDIQEACGFEQPQAIYKWLSGQSLPSIDNLLILTKLFSTTVEGISSFFTVEDYAAEYEHLTTRIKGLIEQIKRGEIWEPKDKAMPVQITYSYIYPNGKNGDIDHFIATEFGKIYQIDSITYRAKISTEEKDQIAKILWWYAYAPSVLEANPDLRELIEFLNTYNRTHILRRICDVFCGITSTPEFHGLGATFSSHPLRNEGRYIADKYIDEVRSERNKIYEYLVSAGKSSGKWVSEQQLFALVKEIYADAIFQYKAEWLESQSLDIYIPCRAIAIEYQGIQHYEPVDFFGGVQGYKDVRSRDAMKREKCINQGVHLLEWKYDVPITRDTVHKLLESRI